MNATEDDPWGYGNSLEWATSSPVPGHNFVSLPRIRSERPAFDLHHPEVTALEHTAPDEALLVAAGRGRTSDDTKENQA
jgi:cytochrome c oxidase subunit 1